MTTRRKLVFSPKSIGTTESWSRDQDTDDGDAPSYSLLQLPPDLLEYLSSATSPALEIRGHPSDVAVLVTPDRTFALRGVQNSNSILLCASGDDTTFSTATSGDGRFKRDIVVHSTLHETLEVTPAVARTDRLDALLARTEYTGEHAENTRGGGLSNVTMADLQAQAPACDAAILAALRASRVITLGPSDNLRRLPPSFLLSILPPLLTSLQPPKKKDTAHVVANLTELIETLDAVDCGKDAALEILRLFGRATVDSKTRWDVDVVALIREIGVCLLAEGGYGAQPIEPFMTRWKAACGPFAPFCDLQLVRDATLPLPTPPTSITYYPLSALSPDPAQRFAELFAARPRWREADMTCFIDDLVGGDKKRRDAMVLKFVRKVKEPGGGVVWTARNNW